MEKRTKKDKMTKKDKISLKIMFLLAKQKK